MSVLSLQGVAVRYRGTLAVDAVELAVRPGRILALVGPSGCGKSSILRVFNRLDLLTPGAQVSGAARFGDLDLLAPGLDLLALRRRIGTIFQQPTPFPLSVTENLELPLREIGLAQGERRSRAAEALRAVGLWSEVEGRLGERADRLSGGQQQRLCLARALVLDPEVLLLDEPCSALDPYSTARVEELLLRLRGERTVVIITHDLAQARRLADDVAVFSMRAGVGTVVEQGLAADVFAGPRTPEAQAFLAGRHLTAVGVR